MALWLGCCGLEIFINSIYLLVWHSLSNGKFNKTYKSEIYLFNVGLRTSSLPICIEIFVFIWSKTFNMFNWKEVFSFVFGVFFLDFAGICTWSTALSLYLSLYLLAKICRWLWYIIYQESITILCRKFPDWSAVILYILFIIWLIINLKYPGDINNWSYLAC